MLPVRRSWLLVVIGAIGCRDARGAPAAPFTGTKQIDVEVTATYGTKYRPDPFHPRLDISVSAGAGDARTIVVVDRQRATTYPCQLNGRLVGNEITLTPGASCQVAVATSQFCLLVAQRCEAKLRDRSCTDEESNHGALVGKVISGKLTRRPSGAWALDANLSADGCVLAMGYNHNAPIHVRGGLLTVRTK